MIDIHSHIIPFVDDGSKSFEQSLLMIREEIVQGVHTIICTPHYRRGSFTEDVEVIKQRFSELKDVVKKNNLDVKLYLGREITYSDFFMKRFSSGNYLSMADSKYILLELPYDTNSIDVDDICYRLISRGCVPILAHVERFPYCRDISLIRGLKDMGVLIQVNAKSIVGKTDFKEKHFANKLIKKQLVDFVSSDIHFNKTNYMLKAYEKVSKKDGAYAERIFKKNALIFLGE